MLCRHPYQSLTITDTTITCTGCGEATDTSDEAPDRTIDERFAALAAVVGDNTGWCPTCARATRDLLDGPDDDTCVDCATRTLTLGGYGHRTHQVAALLLDWAATHTGTDMVTVWRRLRIATATGTPASVELARPVPLPAQIAGILGTRRALSPAALSAQIAQIAGFAVSAPICDPTSCTYLLGIVAGPDNHPPGPFTSPGTRLRRIAADAVPQNTDDLITVGREMLDLPNGDPMLLDATLSWAAQRAAATLLDVEAAAVA